MQQDLDQTVADWKNETRTLQAELSSETKKRNGLHGTLVGMKRDWKVLWKNDQRSKEQAREERQFAREVAETAHKLGRFVDDKTEDLIDAHIELDSVMMEKSLINRCKFSITNLMKGWSVAIPWKQFFLCS